MKDDSRSHDDSKENDDRRKQQTQGNQKKHDERKRSCSSTEERGWSNLGRRQSGVYRRKSLYTEQQEDQEGNSKGKSRFGRCRTSRITQDVGINQENLLVARVKGRYQGIHTRML